MKTFRLLINLDDKQARMLEEFLVYKRGAHPDGSWNEVREAGALAVLALCALEDRAHEIRFRQATELERERARRQ